MNSEVEGEKFKHIVKMQFDESLDLDSKAQRALANGVTEAVSWIQAKDPAMPKTAYRLLDDLHPTWAENRSEYKEEVIGIYRLLSLGESLRQSTSQETIAIRECDEHNGVELINPLEVVKENYLKVNGDWMLLKSQLEFLQDLHQSTEQVLVHDDYSLINIENYYDQQHPLKAALNALKIMDIRVKEERPFRYVLKNEGFWPIFQLFEDNSIIKKQELSKWANIENKDAEVTYMISNNLLESELCNSRENLDNWVEYYGLDRRYGARALLILRRTGKVLESERTKEFNRKYGL
jgi:hypothetical protein